VLLSLEAAIAAVVGFVILGEELEFRAITAVLLVTVVTVGALTIELMKVKMKPVWNSLLALNLVIVSRGRQSFWQNPQHLFSSKPQRY